MPRYNKGSVGKRRKKSAIKVLGGQEQDVFSESSSGSESQDIEDVHVQSIAVQCSPVTCDVECLTDEESLFVDLEGCQHVSELPPGLFYSSLKTVTALVPDGWVVRHVDGGPFHMGYVSNVKLKIQRVLTIYDDLTYQIKVHDVVLAPKATQRFTRMAGIVDVVRYLSGMNVCCGNYDDKFLSKFHKAKGCIVQADFGESDMNGRRFVATIRSSSCDILTPSLRCSSCKVLRGKLRVMEKRTSVSKKRTATSSRVNYRFLTKPELEQRLTTSTKEKKEKERQLRRIRKSVAKEGVQMEDDITSDLMDVMGASKEDYFGKFPNNPFMKLFWEEQCKAAKCKSPRGMRWHPLMIRWCLHIKSQSTAAYRSMLESGMLKLPSLRTLHDYSAWTTSGDGFHADVFGHMAEEAKVDEMEEFQRQVIILMDEIKIKSDLVYNKHTGRLIGFVNTGCLDNQLLSFENTCSLSGVQTESQLASHMIVFMVRSLCSKFRYEVAHFPCQGLTASDLYHMFWETVEHTESFGFRVIAVTGDGASTNRKFFKLHDKSGCKTDVIFKTPIKFPPQEREIFFISDPPHLIKTVRNCFSNSYAHKNSRKLWNDGANITWKSVVELYDADVQRGVRLIKKLKYEHVHLTSHSLMRVNLAAQVLSESVANALELNGDPGLDGTITFIRMFNKLFDCLNVRSFNESHRTRNPDVAPYYSADDSRLLWLKEDFLPYLDRWETSIAERSGMFTKKMRDSMGLSRETLEGLRITVRSVLELIPHILKMEGCKYFLTAKLNQDPLEGEFSIHRQGLGGSDNPTVEEYNRKANLLRVQRSQALASVRGNTKREERNEEVTVRDCEPLPKRRYKRN